MSFIIRTIPLLACSFIANLTSIATAKIAMDFVNVGNPNNPADTTGYGAVDHYYRIGKYEVTNSQYAEFLNAKGQSNANEIYNSSMASYGITQSGSSGSYTYSVTSGFENKPVVYVSWFDAARFANWMSNGQGNGDMETGAYTLNGATSGIITLNSGAQVYLPSRNEWHKAAYYNAATKSYSLYPNGQESMTKEDANYDSSASTNVGNYINDPSSYGTYDQGGNVAEWNDTIFTDVDNHRFVLGGAWNDSQLRMRSNAKDDHPLEYEYFDAGFRLAAASIDTDSDGLDDLAETNTGIYVSPTDTGTNPNSADSDGDGVPDGLEVKEKTSPVDATKFNAFSKGLVAYVPFDDGSNDLSGKARHLTQIGHPILTGGLDGGQAVQFDGIDDAVAFSNDSDMPLYRSDWGNPPVKKIEGPVCLSIWVKRSTGGAANQCIFGKRDYTSFNLVLRDGKFVGEARWPGVQPDPVVASNTGQVADENWHHVVYYWNAPVFRVYLDGNPLSELNAPNILTLANVAHPWVIGAKSDLGTADTEFFKGTVDNIRLYGRALDSAEIAALYVNERPQFQIISGSYTWQQAKADAEARGGRLAVLNTQAKIDKAGLIFRASNPTQGIWIGLTDELNEGDWKWITGEKLTSSNWNATTGEPNNGYGYGDAEHYALIESGWQSTWNDAAGYHQFGYLFENVDQSSNLTIDSSINGRITGAGTYDIGASAALTATPNSGYFFSGWTGDASGTENPLAITMDADKTVGATFVEDTRDPDNDGLTNYQEIIIRLTNPNVADTDGDGINDGAEVQQGRSPSIAEPVITNVVATQRTGTKFFDIFYDLTSTTPTVKMSLEISSDGGATYTVPVTSATGAIGDGVAVGNGKSIVWNAGVDWDAKSSAQMRFRLIADNQIIDGLSLIPAGAFTMGRTSGDEDIDAPPVTVTVSRFYMGKYEVTKALWDEVRTWATTNGYTDLAVGAGKAANHPVQTVSWWDVIKWCNARSQKEGLTPCYTVTGSVMKTGTTEPTVDWTANGYRLPTEAEWEKAARGGLSGKRFPWGTDTISHSQANYYASSSYSYDARGSANNYHPTYNDGTEPYTSPVGSFVANGYGLNDMAGNVYEWCWDWYEASTYVNGSTDPRGAVSGVYRVARGGGWGWEAISCRAASRSITDPMPQYSNIGFRIARNSGAGALASFSSTDTNLDTRMWTLTLSAVVNGSVSGAGSYLSQTNANISATPQPGYLFGSWTGDGTGSTKQLTILMDSDKTVGATFAEDTRDPDSDGLTNYQEIIIRLTNPNLADTDNDGVNDGQEVTDTTNPLVADTDGDGITDGEEKTRTTNPLLVDTDGDGLGDLQEITISQTNPLLSDTNGNGINDALEDTDNDGILNGREVNQLGTNPLLADTNSNGLSDTYELLFQGNTDPFTPRVGDRVRYELGRLGYQGTYKIVGTLPKGLTFNATTGVLEGKLTGTAGTSRLTIQVLNSKTVLRSIPLNLPVLAFPARLAGTWQALLENQQGLPEGLITVVVTSPGNWSATYDGVGTRTIRRASGFFDLVAAQDRASWSITLPAVASLPSATMSFGIDGNTALAAGTHPRGTMQGFRLARGAELPVATRTITMLIDQGVQDGFVIPAGTGWATGSISNRGAVALAGQLGDAQAFRATLSLGATGQALMWLKPYKNLNSYIGGIVSLHGSGVLPASPLHNQESGLWWYRAADATELGYPGGFAAMNTNVGVRSHPIPASALALSQNLGLTEQVIRGVVFDGGGLPDPNAVAKLPESFAIDASYKMVALPIPGQPMAPWTGLIASRTGGFTGTLRVVASNSDTIAGNAAVSGVLFPTVGSRVVGAGLVKIPIVGPKGAFRTGAIVLGTEEEN